MSPRIGRTRLWPADIEALQFAKCQVPNCRQAAAPRQPLAGRIAAKVRLQSEVMKNDQLAVTGQLEVEFGPIKARLRCRRKSKMRVFGPQAGPAAVSNI